MMLVSDLVAHLLTLPQDLPVLAYGACEDHCRLTEQGVTVCKDGEDVWATRVGNTWQARRDAHVLIIGNGD